MLEDELLAEGAASAAEGAEGPAEGATGAAAGATGAGAEATGAGAGAAGGDTVELPDATGIGSGAPPVMLPSELRTSETRLPTLGISGLRNVRFTLIEPPKVQAEYRHSSTM